VYNVTIIDVPSLHYLLNSLEKCPRSRPGVLVRIVPAQTSRQCPIIGYPVRLLHAANSRSRFVDCYDWTNDPANRLTRPFALPKLFCTLPILSLGQMTCETFELISPSGIYHQTQILNESNRPTYRSISITIPRIKPRISLDPTMSRWYPYWRRPTWR
jgi:hypothetical protein